MADDIAFWLEGLGLGQYAQVFIENGVELRHLPHLTDDDLKELGLPLGPRRHLQAAIETHSADQPSVPSAQEREAPPAEAERRQLTVMFCDLVGSTALSSRLDPEEMRDVLRMYQEAASSVVERYDGHVAKYLGDGVLTYFGWPRAHEDDAERATRAGLDAVAAVAAISTGKDIQLQARVGIASGVVVAGDMVGRGVSEEGAIAGETPNLAARFQEVAEPGSVVIGEATHRMAGGLFECRDLGAQYLKGFAEPVTAWAVLRPHRIESRFEVMRDRHLTELLGRDEEVEILLRRWQRAKSGDGQIVLISGEPGIGKSRLSRTLAERIAGESYTPIRLQCSPFHTNSAFYPLIEHFERAAGLRAGDTAESKLEKLEALLALSGPHGDDAPLFATLLSIPTEERDAPRAMTPQRQKELTLAAMVDRTVRLAEQRPVLFELEDAHWIDPSTLEFVDLVLDRVPDANMVVLITYRPEFVAPWVGRPRVTLISLGRLDRQECAALVDRVATNASLTPDMRERIVAQTDGVPLFVEELTKSIIEAGGAPDVSSVPATLRDSLESRLDRLGPAREIAQVGAVIGRTFDYDLLSHVVTIDDGELRTSLDKLVDSGLTTCRGEPPDAIYAFKHALVQDTAYGSLLKSNRRRLHQQIAEALQREFPETAEAEPEILAHHFTEAGLSGPAITNWHLAGKRATGRSANWEAIAHLNKALELLAALPESRERDEQELDLQIDLFGPLVASKGYIVPESEHLQIRALELGRRIGETPKLHPVLYARYSFYIGSTRSVRALEYAEEFLASAEHVGDDTLRMMGHRMVGSGLWATGDWMSSRQHLEQVLTLYNDESHGDLKSAYGHDPKVWAMSYRAIDLWALGYPHMAKEAWQATVGAADALSHPNSSCHALAFGGIILTLLGDQARAEEFTNKLTALSEEYVLPFWASYARFNTGLARFDAGDREDGVEKMIQAFDEVPESTWSVLWIYYATQLADALGRIGRADEGLGWLDRAQAITDEGGERWSEIEIWLVRGDLQISIGSKNEPAAESNYSQALELARSQQAKSWELRAASRIARLWHSQGKTTEALNMLTAVYGWFTEGFDTADLKEAKVLLDELS